MKGQIPDAWNEANVVEIFKNKKVIAFWNFEIKKTNIKVSLIEPGPIEANFNINALKNLKRVKINNSVYKNKYYKMMK